MRMNGNQFIDLQFVLCERDRKGALAVAMSDQSPGEPDPKCLWNDGLCLS